MHKSSPNLNNKFITTHNTPLVRYFSVCWWLTIRMDGNKNNPVVLDVPTLCTNGIEVIPDVYVNRLYAGPHEQEQYKVTDNSFVELDHHPDKVIKEIVNEPFPEMECIDELVYLYRIMEHGSYIPTLDLSNNDTSIKGDTHHILWEPIKSPFYSTWSFLGKRQSIITLKRRYPKYKRKRSLGGKKKDIKSTITNRYSNFRKSRPTRRGKSEERS